MVQLNFLTTAVALTIALAGTTLACRRTCTAVSEDNSHCNYSCTHVCESISATEARTNFLAALRAAGYDCRATGATGVVCRKGGSFGDNCYDHYWTCGSGC